MNNHMSITVFDYMSALDSTSQPHLRPLCETPVPGGCQRCHATITPHDAHFVRFGLVCCSDCIGNDGFATVADLERFRQTATLPCPGCGHLLHRSHVSPDGTSHHYRCPACGTTARYTLTAQALVIYGPGITGNRP
jgi:predicted RNA-binding Zn-ribbon protein involved in translation (DUF1610 family)